MTWCFFSTPDAGCEVVMAVPNRDELIKAAIDVRQRAYARYSNFLVGASILGGDGRIYTGCNVENASFGLTICAERAAVFNAVAAGQRRFELLAIATAGGASPCGACRQVLVEFAPELTVLLIDVDRPASVVETNIRDLLPGAFFLATEN
jgi:cytidine deaminase